MGFFEDMLQIKLDAQLRDHSQRIDAISELFNQLTKGVNDLFEVIEKLRDQEVEYYNDFHIYEVFDELNSRYERFWTEANAARDRHKQNSDWEQFNNAIQTRLHPLALEYVEPAGILAKNLPNVATFCAVWPTINETLENAKKHLDFDYSEFSQIDFDPDVLINLQNILFDSYNSISALGDNLIEEWEPFGDYQDNGWKEALDEQLKIFQNTVSQIENNSLHVRSLFRTLWEIKKQVELSAGSNQQFTGEDAISKIEKLAKLLEKGLITQQEFDEKKSKLLDEI